MDTLLKELDFRGEINIPNTERPEVCEELKRFIERYEPQFFDEVLGVGLASDFYTAAGATPVPVPWGLLIDGGIWTDTRNSESIERRIKGIKFCVARYVYYYYQRNAATVTTGAGEAKPELANAKAASILGKATGAWNDMTRELVNVWVMLRYYEANGTAVFTPYDHRLPAYYKFRVQNAFGI